eukprot:scaffold206124_cov25-Tisochrysis_lutea.AAC.2
MASAHNMPAERHCCSALAMSVCAALRFPARLSSRTASSHSAAAPTFLRRATSSTERALEIAPCRSSSSAAASHIGTHSGTTLSALLSVSRAASGLPMRDST